MSAHSVAASAKDRPPELRTRLHSWFQNTVGWVHVQPYTCSNFLLQRRELGVNPNRHLSADAM
jgi:hypothetical protein